MIRYIYYICFAFVCAGSVGISNASDVTYPFTFEVRIPKEANPNLKTQVSLVAYHGEDKTFLSACKQREDGGFMIFQSDYLIFTEDKPQRGLIVGVRAAPAQVFRLSIPITPKPTDWSQWQRPNYIENADAGFSFSVPDSKATGRSTNIPPVCFEVRYKIESKKID